MPQTTVSFRQGLAIGEGQYATTAPRRVDGVIEGLLVGSTPLPMGRIVVRDPSDATRRRIMLPTAVAATQPPIGIAVLDEEWGVSLGALTAVTNPIIQYPAEANNPGVSFLGDFWMWSEEPILPADIGVTPVLYRYATDAAPNDQLGRVRKTTVAAKTDTLPRAFFQTATAAAGLVIVRFLN